jgi:FAD/FMN-containing dehydrogenase
MAIKKTIAAVRRASEEAGGFAVLESAPVSLKREVGVWGEGMANADLMRKLKSAYDPAGVLGCGRLV